MDSLFTVRLGLQSPLLQDFQTTCPRPTDVYVTGTSDFTAPFFFGATEGHFVSYEACVGV